MNKENIAVLYGGMSGEHEVSIRSAASVEEHLDKNRYRTILIGIDSDGTWYLQKNRREKAGSGPLSIIRDEKNIVSITPGRGFHAAGTDLNIDFVIPVLHGTFGEDGTMQGLLEICGLPYAGAGVLASAVGMDKEKSKLLWQKDGIPVVPFICIKKRDYFGSSAFSKEAAAKAEAEFGLPLFIKPACTGSSVGVNRVDTVGGIAPAIKDSFKYDTKILIEPCIRGKEVECSVVGNNTPEAFTPGEIIPSHEFYDYEAKYIDPDGAALLIPADISEIQMEEIKRIAVSAYKLCDAEGMARVDFFIEENTGRILINEINTIPGFTNISMFARMCEASGLEYGALLDKLIQLGKERYSDRRALSFRRED